MRVRPLWQLDSNRTRCPYRDRVSLENQRRSYFSEMGIQFTAPSPAKLKSSRGGASREARERSCEVDRSFCSSKTQHREHPGRVSGLA